jgi:hypothetical protein
VGVDNVVVVVDNVDDFDKEGGGGVTNDDVE